jgi:hypothetical protein
MYGVILEDLWDKKLLDQTQYDERLDQINLAFAANPSPSGSTRSLDLPQGTFHSPTGSPTNPLVRKLFPGLDKPLTAPNSLPGSSLTLDEDMDMAKKLVSEQAAAIKKAEEAATAAAASAIVNSIMEVDDPTNV